MHFACRELVGAPGADCRLPVGHFRRRYAVVVGADDGSGKERHDSRGRPRLWGNNWTYSHQSFPARDSAWWNYARVSPIRLRTRPALGPSARPPPYTPHTSPLEFPSTDGGCAGRWLRAASRPFPPPLRRRRRRRRRIGERTARLTATRARIRARQVRGVVSFRTDGHARADWGRNATIRAAARGCGETTGRIATRVSPLGCRAG